jgi:hypothetical protein
MLRDAFPPSPAGPVFVPAEREGVPYLAARWTPESLARLASALESAGEIPDLPAAWSDTVEAFLDPGSPERRELSPALARLCRLSPEGLAAGLEAVLGGVRGEAAAALFEEARTLASPAGPVLVVLASNLPALAVQPLLPALALRRPVLLKSPSAEPLFAPAFLAALTRREPRLAGAVAAAVWPGGDARLEEPVLAGAGSVVAYGEGEALADLERRAPGRVVGYGPKTSLAAVGADVDLEMAAAGIARDVALFDQRGCLSVAAVYTAGDAPELAVRLAKELEDLAARWPPGPADAAAVAAVQQARLEAEMRGLVQTVRPPLPLQGGTVLVDSEPSFRPSPGLRTVRVHPLSSLGDLPSLLVPWAGRIQGVALAGEEAWRLAPRLAELGVSRFAPPGELQSPDAAWHNGGIHPLAALSGQPSGISRPFQETSRPRR